MVCPKCGSTFESSSSDAGDGQCPACRLAAELSLSSDPMVSLIVNSANVNGTDATIAETEPRKDFHDLPTYLERAPINKNTDSIWESESGTPLEAAPPRDEVRDYQKEREERIRQDEYDFIGKTIGGYEVRSLLGVGGMGSVCLARQKSLDRNVALKILPARLASNPDFVVRFTREALSAAQITHHNVVQVYDVGAHGNTHFISMEYVRGQTLGEMVRREGALHPDAAASYILQAARGLQHAHSQGVIHRDVKPDNMLINEYGIVKVADMGLAKMRDMPDTPLRIPSLEDRSHLDRARGDLTIAHVSMGTPAYMAPEQARDATSVDPRADQYSLGCSLYYLIAGRPPYEGNSALEIITKQLDAPAPNLKEVSQRVPGILNDIIGKMLRKDPNDRYPTLSDVIGELEGLLGIDGASGPFSPREQHLTALEHVYRQYYSAPLARPRKLAVAGFFAGTALLATLGMLTGFTELAHIMIATLLATPFLNVVLDGILHKDYFSRRLRGVLWHAPWQTWCKALVAAAVVTLVMVLLKIHWWWFGGVLLAGALAAAYQLLLVRRLEVQRSQPLDDAAELLKHLRLRGLGEEAVQDFVCRFGGKDWEELFEDLFGYEALIAARGKSAKTEHLRGRRQHSVWRDPIARWLDQVEETRRRNREHRTLVRAEARRLKAQGASRKDAARQAELNAKAMSDTIVRAVEKPKPVATHKSSPLVMEFARSNHRATGLDRNFQAVRFIVGTAMLVYILTYKFGSLAPEILRKPVIAILQAPLPDVLVQLMLGIWGAAVCAALVLSAYTTRRISGLLVVAGAAMIGLSAWLKPMVAAVLPMRDETWTLTSTALMVLGLVIALPVRVRKRKPPSLQ